MKQHRGVLLARPFASYLFIIPAILLTLGSVVYPFMYNAVLSFYSTVRGTLDQYVGFSNYKNLLASAYFWNALLRTILFSFGTAVGALLAGLLLALSVHHVTFRGKLLFLGLLFVPWVMGYVETGIIWRWLLHPLLGTVGRLLGWSVLGSTKTALFTLTMVNIWKHTPFALVTIYAAFQMLPKDMYEAAIVDGANSWQMFKYVTMPQIRSILIATGLLLAIWQLAAFTLFDIMTEGGPLRSTEVLTVFMYNLFQARQFGLAAAVAMIMFALAYIITIVYLRLEFKRLVEEA